VDADALAAKLPYAVQLGAFAELERAQHLARVLEAQGYPAEVEDRDSQKGHEMHYVRLADGYDSMAAASKAAAALKRKLDIDAIPVRRGGAGSDR
jgi:cell division septation protein DedD